MAADFTGRAEDDERAGSSGSASDYSLPASGPGRQQFQTPHEYNYVREKIFTEEGRKYADAEIPFVRDQASIVNIRARTVHPDGSIVKFDGKVYEKEIVKGRNIKVLAKTFTFSDVQPGSIIEYHYMIDFAEGYVFDSNWILSDELFTKSAKFTLKPSREFSLRWSWPNGLPAGVEPPVQPKSVVPLVSMEAKNIPAFQIEDDMPPEEGMKFRVDFNYNEGLLKQMRTRFWKKEGQETERPRGKFCRQEEGDGRRGGNNRGGERYA